MSAGLAGGDHVGGHLIGVDQEQEQLLREGEADPEADEQRPEHLLVVLGQPQGQEELARVLADRLQHVETYGGKCRTSHDAEAQAFLAKLRRLLEEMGG